MTVVHDWPGEGWLLLATDAFMAVRVGPKEGIALLFGVKGDGASASECVGDLVGVEIYGVGLEAPEQFSVGPLLPDLFEKLLWHLRFDDAESRVVFDNLILLGSGFQVQVPQV